MAGPESKSVVPSQSSVPSQVQLGPNTTVDLSWMTEAERRALLTDYTKGMMDLSLRAQKLNVDVAALDNTLRTMSATVKDVTKDGTAVTISNVQETSVGRTEVLIGNTDKARSGRLSKSQTGEFDWTPVYYIVGVIALIIIVAIFVRR
jgi:hypothetical protein